MADRYFQCAYCKILRVQDDTLCYITKGGGITAANIENEICDCKVKGSAFRKRMRELTQVQYNMEVALNRPINNP